MAEQAGPSGGACGYSSRVSLFGGPTEIRGCGQTIPPGKTTSASPSVQLPPGGSAKAITAADADGALAQYGPAVIFAGKGPQKVSTKGKTSVTSSASVKSVGPGPFTADAVSSTCKASGSGATASTTITKGKVVTAADSAGNPTASETVPTRPPVDHTLSGVNSIGDTFKVVFNEQKVDPDGTITVNAVHLYLLGPTAIGDVIVAQSSARA